MDQHGETLVAKLVGPEETLGFAPRAATNTTNLLVLQRQPYVVGVTYHVAIHASSVLPSTAISLLSRI